MKRLSKQESSKLDPIYLLMGGLKLKFRLYYRLFDKLLNIYIKKNKIKSKFRL